MIITYNCNQHYKYAYTGIATCVINQQTPFLRLMHCCCNNISRDERKYRVREGLKLFKRETKLTESLNFKIYEVEIITNNDNRKAHINFSHFNNFSSRLINM